MTQVQESILLLLILILATWVGMRACLSDFSIAVIWHHVQRNLWKKGFIGGFYSFRG